MKFKSFLRDDEPIVVPPSGEITIGEPVPAPTAEPSPVNPPDTIRCEVALFIRLLEFAKENAKTDVHLHEITEHALQLSTEGRPLTMDDYPAIVGGLSSAEDNPSATPNNVHTDGSEKVVNLTTEGLQKRSYQWWYRHVMTNFGDHDFDIHHAVDDEDDPADAEVTCVIKGKVVSRFVYDPADGLNDNTQGTVTDQRR